MSVKLKVVNSKVIKEEKGKPTEIVGCLQKDLCKLKRNASNHLHYEHNGWGIDCELVEILVNGYNVKYVHIYDEFFNENYFADIQTIKAFGIQEDFNHSLQYIVPKKYWSREIDFVKYSPNLVHLHVHSEYCLAPDTLIYNCGRHHNRGQLYRQDYTRLKKCKTIKYLYDNWHKGKGSTFRYQVKVFDGEKFVPSLIKNIKKSSPKQLYKITTETGKSIEASILHKFLTDKGWRRLGQLEAGEKLACNGRTIEIEKDWLYQKYRVENLRTYEIANLIGCHRETIEKNIRIFGLQKNNSEKLLGHSRHKRDELINKKAKTKNGSRFKARWLKKNVCEICQRDNDLDIHHKDKDVFNNKEENLITLCSKCHGKQHYTQLQTVKYEKIISIAKTNIEETYDIEVCHKSHNFVANGIVTHNSLLDGMCRLEELVLKAKRMNMSALALTDHGTVQGNLRFHKLCNKVGIKPILGSEFYLCEYADVKQKGMPKYHLVLLAKNQEGYHNLLKLSTYSHTEGFYYTPRIDRDMLLKYHKGLICLTACLAGPISRNILKGTEELRIYEELVWWKELFGQDFYVEIMPDMMPEYYKINPELIRYAKSLNIQFVATADVHYIEKEDKITHDALWCIQKKILMKDNPGMVSDTYYFMSEDEMKAEFEKNHPLLDWHDIETAIQNTRNVADKVENYSVTTDIELPVVDDEINFEEYVKTQSGYFPECRNQEYQERLNYEIGVIKELGFERYFILIGTIISWANLNGILVGAGRGSSAGSLVAYVMRITRVDPIKFGLIFERFLNPARRVMPDIDIDFDAARQHEVFEYIRSKWHAARISTYVCMQSKGALKDIGRVFGIPLSIVEQICKGFPTKQSSNMTIDKGILTEQTIEKFYRDYPKEFEIARRLEGRLKTRGIHPAGIIISDTDISDVVGLRLEKGSKGDVVIQADMEDTDTLGLLKVDILASKTQTVLSLVKKLSGFGEFKDIPLDDKNVFRNFTKGNCYDIFQFQSDLCRETTMKIKPKNFDDLVAITAVIRPGAFDFIDDFKKNDYEPILPEMKPILKDTRNIILYQEQSMKIAVEIAGFTFQEADDLRKAIGKKKLDVMSKLRYKFVEGGVRNGFERVKVAQVFSIIEKSANYSFNHSHAVAYTLSSYWSMFFKVYYPKEWSVALMTVHIEDTSKIKRYVEDARNNKIKVLTPSVNKSDFGFNIDDDSIRCGVGMIKQVSEKGYKELIKHRPYKSFDDFIHKVSGRALNKGAIDNLIKAGAFDEFEEPREHLKFKVKELKMIKKKKDLSSIITAKKLKTITFADKVKAEKEAFGFYLSGHPLDEYSEDLQKHGIETKTGYHVVNNRIGLVAIGGLIEKIKKHQSKNGEMAFLEISSIEDWSIILWNRTWNFYQKYLKKNRLVVIYGRKIDSGKKIAVDITKGDKIVFITKI